MILTKTAMSMDDVKRTLDNMSIAEKSRISAEGRKQYRGMNGRIDYKKNAVNAGIYKNDVLIGDKNVKGDAWEEYDMFYVQRNIRR